MNRSIAFVALALLLGTGCQGGARESPRQAAREAEQATRVAMQRTESRLDRASNTVENAVDRAGSEVASEGRDVLDSVGNAPEAAADKGPGSDVTTDTGALAATCACPEGTHAARRPRTHRAAAYPMTAAPVPVPAGTSAAEPESAACPSAEPVACPPEVSCPGPTVVTVPVPVTHVSEVSTTAPATETRLHSNVKGDTTSRAGETRVDTLRQTQRANYPAIEERTSVVP